MLICFDIGNSTVNIGFFEGKTLRFSSSIPSSPRLEKEQWKAVFIALLDFGKLTVSDIEAVVISSVVPEIGKTIGELSRDFFEQEPFVITPSLNLGLGIHIDNPLELGADLLCDAIGGYSLYGGDLLIVDMGTATKIVLVNENGDFEGCTIGVGPGIAKAALFHGTSALPEVEFSLPEKVLGKNTEDSINSALFYGLSVEAKGLCDLLEKEYGKKLRRVLTGGYSNLVEPLMEGFLSVKDLALLGANEAYFRASKRG